MSLDLHPEPEAARKIRLATEELMYADTRQDDDDEEAEFAAEAFPPPSGFETAPPAPTTSGLLSTAARQFMAAHPAKAGRLLEWAADVHEPRRLVLDLGVAKLSLLYVKLERRDISNVFYLDVGSPGISLDFGTELTIEFEGETLTALVSVAQEMDAGKAFPYTRLEFFNAGKHTPAS